MKVIVMVNILYSLRRLVDIYEFKKKRILFVFIVLCIWKIYYELVKILDIK